MHRCAPAAPQTRADTKARGGAQGPKRSSAGAWNSRAARKARRSLRSRRHRVEAPRLAGAFRLPRRRFNTLTTAGDSGDRLDYGLAGENREGSSPSRGSRENRLTTWRDRPIAGRWGIDGAKGREIIEI